MRVHSPSTDRRTKADDVTRALIALSAAVVAVLAGCTATPASDPTATPTEPAVEQIDSLGATEISATPFPDWITATDAGVWVANVGAGLVRYDDAGAKTAEVPTGDIALAMDVGFGSLWAGSTADGRAEVVRVDIGDPGSVTRIPLPGVTLAEESSIAATDDAVWVLTTSDPRTIVAIDPADNTVRGTLPVAENAAALRGGFGSLWVTRNADDTVDRVDPATGEVLASIPVGPYPQFLAVGDDAVWVMNQFGPSVSRIDAETEEVTTVPLPGRRINGGDIAASADAVWVRTSSGLAVRIDPLTATVTRRIGPAAGSGSIAIDGTSVWISAHDVTTVWRIDD